MLSRIKCPRSTSIDMNLQRLCLSQNHVAEIFSKQENTTILTDETSKFCSKYMRHEAADANENLSVLGLRYKTWFLTPLLYVISIAPMGKCPAKALF